MTTDQLPEPGAFAVSNHRAWIGRKEANLRRRLLDCGCQNLGEVFFRLWCDRLACREHADGPHDCREYKGGIEEESAPVEPETETTTFELAPGTTVTLPAVATVTYEITRPSFTLADMEAASAAVRALHAPPVDAGSEPQTYATGGVVETEGFVLIAEDDGCTGRMPWVDVRPWWRRMLRGTR